MRLGVDADAVVDSHSLLMNAARLGEEALVIGISYSGATEEVIDAMYQIGCAMPSCIRETGEGGLAVTPTGQAAKRRLS